MHGTAGLLVNHAKELMLHGDVGPEDRFLYFTTCGWMMWNWQASALMTGAADHRDAPATRVSISCGIP